MQLKKNGTLDKPVALPRQTVKKNSSENEDEGISSSETGESSPCKNSSCDDDCNTTIDDVIEELTNIVNDAEREIKESQQHGKATVENDSMIIPSNLLPQPPKKSNKSLIQIFGAQHDIEDSDYDYYIHNNNMQAKTEELYENDYELNEKNHPDIVSTVQQQQQQQQQLKRKDDGNRQLLNVIMDAREKEHFGRAHSLERDIFPPQKFNGVFFMSDMNPMTPTTKFSKPDIMAALESKRAAKNCGVNSMIDVVMTTQEKVGFSSQVKQRQIFLPAGAEQFSTNVNFNNFKFKNTNVNPGLFYDAAGNLRESRTQSNNGSKVTDLVSGLY
jgi:hypothetical protein